MANTLKPKRTYTTSNVPSGLSAGELAVNAADGKVWIGNAAGDGNVLIASLSLADMTGSTTNITEGNKLFYTDARARLSVSAGTGISYNNSTGAITNSAPDQTVVLTSGTGISTSGTYPNFTITNTSPDQTVVLTAGTGISVSGTYPNFTITNTSPSVGTVTSVAMTAPVGLKVTGSPITGSGTLALALDTGYAIPTSASQTNWDSAYTQRLQWDGGSTNLTAATGRTSLGATTIGSNLFTLTNPTAVTFPRFNADNTVSSLDAATFRSAIGAGTSSTTGTVTSVSMTVPTGLSVSGSPITSTGTLGVTFTAGYSIPTTTSQTNWDTAYNNRITSLTTTGSSGSATLVSNTLNIPTYTLSGLGGQASSTNLTSLSGLTYAATSFVKMTASGTFGLDTNTYLTGNQSITLSGDASGTGTTAITVTLATVSATKGGTGQTSYTLGDILYCSAANTLSKLAGNITSGKQFLTQTGTGTVSAAPAWATLSSADVTTALGFTPASPGGNSGEFQYKNASGGFSGTSALQFQATAFEDIRVYGTSTSRVPFSIYVPSSTSFNWFEINSVNSVNYVTIDNFGHLNLFQGNLNNYNNVVFTNSNTGRTITLARPSTFAASFTLTLPTSAGTNGQVLLSGGGASPLQWGNSVSNLNGGDGFTLKGSIPYQSDVNTTTLLSPNTTTTRKFLRQTGTGTNGAAPAWDTLTSSDITTALGYTPASGSGSTAAAANLYLANNFGGF